MEGILWLFSGGTWRAEPHARPCGGKKDEYPAAIIGVCQFTAGALRTQSKKIFDKDLQD
jgi:hypothetical protein